MSDVEKALGIARELVAIDEAGRAYVLPESLRLARALLALHREHLAMAAVVEAAEKLSPRIEPFAGGDWACAECRPDSDILVAGFQCHVHALRTALSTLRAAKGER